MLSGEELGRVQELVADLRRAEDIPDPTRRAVEIGRIKAALRELGVSGFSPPVLPVDINLL
jgi:hypothetical protein